jgi:hypothetical protein
MPANLAGHCPVCNCRLEANHDRVRHQTLYCHLGTPPFQYTQLSDVQTTRMPDAFAGPLAWLFDWCRGLHNQPAEQRRQWDPHFPLPRTAPTPAPQPTANLLDWDPSLGRPIAGLSRQPVALTPTQTDYWQRQREWRERREREYNRTSADTDNGPYVLGNTPGRLSLSINADTQEHNRQLAQALEQVGTSTLGYNQRVTEHVADAERATAQAAIILGQITYETADEIRVDQEREPVMPVQSGIVLNSTRGLMTLNDGNEIEVRDVEVECVFADGPAGEARPLSTAIVAFRTLDQLDSANLQCLTMDRRGRLILLLGQRYRLQGTFDVASGTAEANRLSSHALRVRMFVHQCTMTEYS